ncbi:hypothetical protein [Leyella lascolaii]|uniref:hypothetical protein n=1 Tax=Leyella lascolaii TaxID=1776379 RepID=UPI0013DCD829|nr:hypothetical protein [Leyella lascolaii]
MKQKTEMPLNAFRTPVMHLPQPHFSHFSPHSRLSKATGKALPPYRNARPTQPESLSGTAGKPVSQCGKGSFA